MQIIQSTLTVDSRPRAAGPEIYQGDWTFQCLDLKLLGTAQLGDSASPVKPSPTLPPSKSPVGMGWRIGWVQVNAQEWYWALYRDASGQSATLQTWPTYSALDNEDRDGNDLFYKVATGFYQQLGENQRSGSIGFVDMPLARFKPKISVQGGDALLSSIGVRLSFVCALAARDPDDALYVLKWVPWFVQWSCDFASGPRGLVANPLAAGTKAGVGQVQTGVPAILAQALANARGSTAQVQANDNPRSTILSGQEIENQLTRLRTRL